MRRMHFARRFDTFGRIFPIFLFCRASRQLKRDSARIEIKWNRDWKMAFLTLMLIRGLSRELERSSCSQDDWPLRAFRMFVQLKVLKGACSQDFWFMLHRIEIGKYMSLGTLCICNERAINGRANVSQRFNRNK